MRLSKRFKSLKQSLKRSVFSLPNNTEITMRITVTVDLSKECRHIYEFNTFDMNVVLVGVREERKPQGKRAWKMVSFWDNYNKRYSTIKESPPLPLEVRRKAGDEMVKMIRVMTWDEWKKI